MSARRRGHKKPEGYDASEYPRFAVTVDVVILTIADEQLQVLLVRRRDDPYKGMWALPGGFKRPNETLADAASRELREETGVEAAAYLSEFGAYGDPGRDPRMNVVSVGFLAVLRDVGELAAGSDAEGVSLRPVGSVLAGDVELAFDHDRILRDAVERARRDLETTSLAKAFVGPTFTLTNLRNVFEAVWETRLDAANFHRTMTRSPGLVTPTGTRAAPSPAGGKPAETYRFGSDYDAAPLRRPPPEKDESEDEG
ncbi:MAG TPA: NUDIX domain-containing protein [Acidimicrobiales bacterium]|nr:NUDIX domain-containing protein [Acidimicrobiales bacterium]